MNFEIGDVVVDKRVLGQIVGKSNNGDYVIEWASGELDRDNGENLFLVEKKDNGISSEN